MLSSFTRESCPKKEENILWTLWEFKTCWRYLNSLPKLEIVLKIELKRNTWLRLVFPPSRLSCSCLVLRALQQNRVKSSLLYFFNKTSILNISNNSICLDHELCTNSLTPVSPQHKCKFFAFSVKRRQARGERLARVRCEGRSAKKYILLSFFSSISSSSGSSYGKNSVRYAVCRACEKKHLVW